MLIFYLSSQREDHVFKLTRYFKAYKWQVILGPFFKLSEAIIELIVPLVMAQLIDYGIRYEDTELIREKALIMVGMSCLGLAFSLTAQWMASRASQGIGTDLRDDLFSHIQKLSYRQMDRFGSDTLVTRMTSDINQIQLVVAMFIRLVSRAPFLAIGAIYMAFRINVQLTWIFMLIVPLISIILWILMKAATKLFKQVQKKLDTLGRLSRENLSGARVIRAFGASEKEQAAFNTECLKQVNIVMNINRITTLISPVVTLTLNGAIALLLWFSSKQVDLGKTSQGNTIALVNYLIQISLALVVVANLVIIFTRGAASASRINELFDTEPDIKDRAPSPVKFKKSASHIEIKNLSFGYYKGREKVINNISFKVDRGQRIGIIGGTGSGKSTLIQLLARFYEADQGEILINGVDVKEYPKEQLRGLFGYVPQEALLFSGTIASNLRLGKEDAKDEELFKALEVAQMEDTVKALPDKLYSRVSKGGANFSGGQKQRLIIARALVKQPEILIFDDSFSALDYVTESRLHEALRENFGKTTQLIISQRIRAIEGCDQIYVLEKGSIVGRGTHKELLKYSPMYKEIVDSQTKGRRSA